MPKAFQKLEKMLTDKIGQKKDKQTQRSLNQIEQKIFEASGTDRLYQQITYKRGEAGKRLSIA